MFLNQDQQYKLNLLILQIKTGAVLLGEMLVKSLWRITYLSLFFATLILFGIPQSFGIGAVIAVLLFYLFASGWFALQDGHHFKIPRLKDILRRIETDNHLKHRPLSSKKSDLFSGAKEFWTLFQNKKTHLKTLETPGWSVSLTKSDPYALRGIILLLFIASLFVTGADWKNRFHDAAQLIAFKPPEEAKTITVQITPPDYTNFKKLVLEEKPRQNIIIDLPTDTTVQITMRTRFGTPKLYNGETKQKFTKLDQRTYQTETTLTGGEKLRITQFLIPRFAISYNLIEDTPPVMALSDDPEAMPDGQLRIPLTLYDDYGTSEIKMSMTLDPMIEDTPLGHPQEETRSLISVPAEPLEAQPLFDFSANPWAGLPARITLTVFDDIGQSATLKDIEVTLPERQFYDPAAQQIIDLRKRLIWERNLDMPSAAAELFDLLTTPHKYQYDTVAFLALRSATSRIFYTDWENDTDDTILYSLVALLWDTALRIEDGNLSLAARELRDAQSQLEQALKNPETSDEKLAQLMENFQQKMAKYLNEMNKELTKRLENGEFIPLIPPEMLEKTINPQAFLDFLEQMQSDILNGDRKSAQDMLNQLQQFLDQMSPSIAGPMPPDMQMMQSGVNELQELIERQEDLREQTINQIKNAINQTIDTTQNKAEQEALRYILGELMLEADRILREIPENMGLAEQAMGQSAETLGRSDPETSVHHQTDAIRYLKEAQDDLQQQLQQKMQRLSGGMLPYFSDGGQRDPLGRPRVGQHDQNDRPGHGSDVMLPEEQVRKRVQEILKILRDRSGELFRPREEREYLRRLLRQF